MIIVKLDSHRPSLCEVLVQAFGQHLKEFTWPAGSSNVYSFSNESDTSESSIHTSRNIVRILSHRAPPASPVVFTSFISIVHSASEASPFNFSSEVTVMTSISQLQPTFQLCGKFSGKNGQSTAK